MKITEKIVYNHFKKVWEEQSSLPLYKDFYIEKKKVIQELSKKYNIEEVKVAGIYAALSPLKSVEQNERLVENFLKGKWVGHFGKQKEKVKRIVSTVNVEEIANILHGEKTMSFFLTLNDCNTQVVVIDRHILKLVGKGIMLNITPKRYKIISSAIKKLAKEVNLLPCEVQCGLWYRAKELYGNNI